MAANSFAAQNGTEKLSTDALTTVNGTNVAADLIEVQRMKMGFGGDGVLNDVTSSVPLPVTQPDVTASGTLLLLNDAVPIAINGDGSWAIDLSGFSGHVVTFESQVNSGSTWRAINGALQGVGSLSSLASADGIYRGAAAGLAGIRARLSTIGTGTVTASLRASVSSGGVFLMSPVTGSGGAALALDGADIATPTAMPAGGVGIRGWLSSIWTKLNGILSVVITSNGFISTLNSSSTPLGTSGALTGTGEDVTEWGEARVSVFADQAGATDGFQMQQSTNNVNWDLIDSYTIPASSGKTFSVALSQKFFRVVNTNGGVAQGVMRLQTKYFKSYNKGSSVRPQDGRSIQNDCEEVNANLMGYEAASASWNMLRSSIANGLAVDVTRVPAGASSEATLAGVRTDLGTDGTTPPAVLGTGTGVRGWLRSIYEKLTGTIAVTNAGTFAVQSAATLAAETTKVIGTVNQAGITKGTQGVTGVTTQDLKDAGRVNIAMSCYQAVGIITTEALFAAAAFSISRDGAAATTGQQLAVTAGKRFRLQSIVIGIKNVAAAAGSSKLVLRYAAAGGTITNTSPILAILDMGSNSTTAAAYIGPTEMALPDGIELLGGSTFGFTNLCSAASMVHTISLNGFEY